MEATAPMGISLSQGDPKAMEMDPEISRPASFGAGNAVTKASNTFFRRPVEICQVMGPTLPKH